MDGPKNPHTVCRNLLDSVVVHALPVRPVDGHLLEVIPPTWTGFGHVQRTVGAPDMSWLDSFDNLGVNIRNLFRAMNTEPLPWKEKRARSGRYRASFALVHNEHGEEACIGCKMCEKICPSQIITVVPGGRQESPVTGKKRGTCKDFVLDLNACIICELCVQVCPEDAILMLKVQEQPGYQREDLVLTMDKLYENEKLGATTWATGAKLIAMQTPLPPPAKPKTEAVAKPNTQSKVTVDAEPIDTPDPTKTAQIEQPVKVPPEEDQ